MTFGTGDRKGGGENSAAKTELAPERAVTEFVRRCDSVPLRFWECRRIFSREAEIMTVHYVNLNRFDMLKEIG